MQLQCINPINAGFNQSGDLVFSSKKMDRGQVPFAFECRKCLPCRLNNAREKAIRCVHESQMHQNNIFLTLTYSDQHLRSPRLNYKDFQDFMKRLRETREEKINYLVTGEYGDKTKRPHWHAILFNYKPEDALYLRTTDRGDHISSSVLLDEIWGKNDPKKKPNEIGEVSLESAGYVARYAAKKLAHGHDQSHDYHPVHKTSSRRAIGRTWIEKYYEHTFKNGFVVHKGMVTKIPRYYVDWARQHKPELWRHYVTEVRPKIHEKVIQQQQQELEVYLTNRNDSPFADTRQNVKETILKSRFKRLQEHLKL